MTCYSALLYLLAVFGTNNCVGPTDALDMIKLTPTQRLEWLRNNAAFAEARPVIEGLLAKYRRFLEVTNSAEEDLLGRFKDRGLSREYLDEAYAFGDCMFEALNHIGRGNRFHRLLVV